MSQAADHPKYEPELEGFNYPYEVQHHLGTDRREEDR